MLQYIYYIILFDSVCWSLQMKKKSKKPWTTLYSQAKSIAKKRIQQLQNECNPIQLELFAMLIIYTLFNKMYKCIYGRIGIRQTYRTNSFRLDNVFDSHKVDNYWPVSPLILSSHLDAFIISCKQPTILFYNRFFSFSPSFYLNRWKFLPNFYSIRNM